MFVIAFHTFLRIGEITKTSQGICNALQDNDIELQYRSKKLHSIHILLRKYKHSKDSLFTLQILTQACLFCPVKCMSKYLSIRTHGNGPLFIFQNRKYVSASYFNTELKTVITIVMGSSQGYSSICFCIGVAAHCLIKGYSKDTISKLGRWHTNSIEKYSRIPASKI